MTKGGKRYANMDQDGKWFAHVGLQHCGVTREACTTTGAMLSQAISQYMQGQERYPKTFIIHNKKTTSRSYPFSQHDNRCSMQGNIEAYSHGLGRKKCLDDRRQHNSYFCFCHDGSVSAAWSGSRCHSAYQSDYLPKQSTESTWPTRHFPRNHLEKSQQAAVAQAKDCFMWFGRHDMDQHIPLNILAATNHSSALNN